MSKARQEKHFVYLNVIGFILTFALGIVGGTLPEYSSAQTLCFEVGSSAFIFSCTITGLRLAEDRWTLPAAGFTMLAIAYGVFYASLFEIHSHAEIEKSNTVFAAGVILFIPAMFLIAYYSEFPRWLRLAGLVACIPFTIVALLVFTHHPLDSLLLEVSGDMGFVLLYSVSLIWGLFFLRQRAKRNDDQQSV